MQNILFYIILIIGKTNYREFAAPTFVGVDIKSDMSRLDHRGNDFMSKEILNNLTILRPALPVCIKSDIVTKFLPSPKSATI
jgi:hypothetical protein